jgi:membrane protein insertase Oxa1/YidC/SpoIIIJ
MVEIFSTFYHIIIIIITQMHKMQYISPCCDINFTLAQLKSQLCDYITINDLFLVILRIRISLRITEYTDWLNNA